MRNWRVWLGVGLVGVGAYLAYRWYRGRKGLAGYGLGGSPRWMGYGRPQARLDIAKAFGAETAQTQVYPQVQPVAAADDVEMVPEGAQFTDDDGEGAEF